MGSRTRAGGAGAASCLGECFPGPFQIREVDREGMVGPSGIAERTENMASALGARREGVHGAGRGLKQLAVP